MKKTIIGLIFGLAVSVLITGVVLACVPDPAELVSCDTETPCTGGDKYCYDYGSGGHCYTQSDPCVVCSYPAMCTVRESYPPQISCDRCSDFTYSNCPELCEKKCVSSGCTGDDGWSPMVCTTDCEGEGSCFDPVSAHDLIKGESGSTIYMIEEFVGKYKRSPFPNLTTFSSWQDNFSRVKIISDLKLQSYPLSGTNQTSEPGHLVKITTDPKVYYVSNCGALHWIISEELALEIAGLHWADYVDDLPDEFFGNYYKDTDITSVQDYAKILHYDASNLEEHSQICNPVLAPTC